MERAASSSAEQSNSYDVDHDLLLPFDRQEEVFGEIATMEYAWCGIPTVPPVKDKSHLTFFYNGTRYRMEATPEWTVEAVKKKLEKKIKVPWQDQVLIYAGQRMANDKRLSEYGVPHGCLGMIATDRQSLESGKPDQDSPYWF